MAKRKFIEKRRQERIVEREATIDPCNCQWTMRGAKMESNDTKRLIKVVEEFYKLLIKDPFGRYRSWEHCYKQFYGAITRGDLTEEKIDYLSLHLGMYLASWGMYRGSSFLLQQDYWVHKEVVREIVNPIYRPLLGIKCSNLRLEKNLCLLRQLSSFIYHYYEKKCVVANKHRQSGLEGLEFVDRRPREFRKPTETLITKILMGTLGCTPAYDTYFIKGISAFNFMNRHFRLGSESKSLNELIDFFEKHEGEFKIRSRLKLQEDKRILYPEMKLLDMMFWRIGRGPSMFELNEREENG